MITKKKGLKQRKKKKGRGGGGGGVRPGVDSAKKYQIMLFGLPQILPNHCPIMPNFYAQIYQHSLQYYTQASTQ